MKLINIIFGILMVVIVVGTYAVGLPILYKKRHYGTPWLPDITQNSPLTEENLGHITEDTESETRQRT